MILFESQDKTVVIPVQLQDDTVWLNRNQMAELFGRNVKTIGKHIGNALREELDDSTVAKFATVQTEGGRSVQRDIRHLMQELRKSRIADRECHICQTYMYWEKPVYRSFVKYSLR